MLSCNKQILNHLLRTLGKLFKCFAILQPKVETINVFSLLLVACFNRLCANLLCVYKNREKTKKQTKRKKKKEKVKAKPKAF